jgi:hypothetical protein
MQNHGDIRIGAVGRPQRDLLIEMYDRFEPLGRRLGYRLAKRNRAASGSRVP